LSSLQGARPLVRVAQLRWPRYAQIEGYLYLLPALCVIGVWVYWPLVSTLALSFFQWNLLPTVPRKPVGFENYVDVLTLPEMGQAVLNTAVYVGGLLPFSVILPLGIALLVADIGGRWRAVYRAVLFVPVLMAPVIVATLWRWLLHPISGVLNAGLLGAFGLVAPNIFRDPRLAIWGIVGITAWMLFGFSILIFSAGLTGISREYIEAAEIDGASSAQAIWHIVLPLLSPTILFMVLLTVLLSAQWTFPIINVLTAGGPLNSTTNVYYLLWDFGFHNFNVGFSSAAAAIFFVAFGLLAWVFVRLADRYSFYDA
jgi:multiple sugar transport system permease protein